MSWFAVAAIPLLLALSQSGNKLS